MAGVAVSTAASAGEERSCVVAVALLQTSMANVDAAAPPTLATTAASACRHAPTVAGYHHLRRGDRLGAGCFCAAGAGIAGASSAAP